MGKLWYKTIADIFADVLSTRSGDRLFFQLTGRAVGDSSSLQDYLSHVNFTDAPSFSTTSNGFTGILQIDGRPFFDPVSVGSSAVVPPSVPVRVPIDCNRYLPRAVTEERAFTYESGSTELWNPKYKKALQGAKSLTSMTPAEGDQLATLIHSNNDRSYEVDQEEYPGDTSKIISIDDRLDQDAGAPGVRESPPSTINELSLNEIPFTRGDKFRVEKTLEAWLMEMIDSHHTGLRKVFGPREELEWFTNYVPYGISGSNMDGLVFHERDGVRYKISPIELKKDKAGAAAVKQVSGYARWVTNYLAGGNSQVVQPVLIAHDFSNTAVSLAKAQLDPRPPLLASYEISRESCHLDIVAGQPAI